MAPGSGAVDGIAFDVCQNRNLWGVEDFQEITIRHSKYAASRFAHEAAPTPRPTDVRQVEDISLLELGAALRDCASEDPETEAARRFGVRRLSTAARTRLARAKPPQGHFAR